MDNPSANGQPGGAAAFMAQQVKTETSATTNNSNISNNSSLQASQLSSSVKPAVIPRCSSWFQMDKINPIEKRMLPEFFHGPSAGAGSVANKSLSSISSKTPQVYMTYRNYMINAYRQQPQVYLTATACRRNLAGDACAILRVHEFLTHWGLINYHVPPHAMPPSFHPNYALKPTTKTKQFASAGSSTSAFPFAIGQKLQEQRQQQQKRLCASCGVGRVLFELSDEAKQRFRVNASGLQLNGTTNTNASTSSNHTSHSSSGGGSSSGAGGVGATGASANEMILNVFASDPGHGLCEDCFARHAFPDSMDAMDFVQTRDAIDNDEPQVQWSEEETMTLLNAIGTSRHIKAESMNWDEIASHLQGKSASDCMVHFLQLPLLQRQQDQSVGAIAEDDSVIRRPFEYAHALNQPVLNMKELVGEVDPLVAKAAVHAAIKAVKQLHEMPAVETEQKSLDQSVKSSSTATEQAEKENKDEEATADVLMTEAAESIQKSSEDAGLNASSPPSTTSSLSNGEKLAEVAAPASEHPDQQQGDQEHPQHEAQGEEQDKDNENKELKPTGQLNESSPSQLDSNPEDPAVDVSKEKLAVAIEASNATKVALVAASRAHAIQQQEEQMVDQLVMELLSNQMQQMQLRMNELQVLTESVQAERVQLAKEKYEFYVERLGFAQKNLSEPMEVDES